MLVHRNSTDFFGIFQQQHFFSVSICPTNKASTVSVQLNLSPTNHNLVFWVSHTQDLDLPFLRISWDVQTNNTSYDTKHPYFALYFKLSTSKSFISESETHLLCWVCYKSPLWGALHLTTETVTFVPRYTVLCGNCVSKDATTEPLISRSLLQWDLSAPSCKDGTCPFPWIWTWLSDSL